MAGWASSYLFEEAEGLLGGRGGQDGVAAPWAGPQGEGKAGYDLSLQLCDADLFLCHCQQCFSEHGLRQWGHHLRKSGARVGEGQESSTTGVTNQRGTPMLLEDRPWGVRQAGKICLRPATRNQGPEAKGQGS